MPRPSALPVLRISAALALACVVLSSCGPLIVGSGAAIIADEVVEDQQGGDGLF